MCTVTRALGTITRSCVKCIASGPLTTQQFSAQSVQPFPRYGKGDVHVHVCSGTCNPPLTSLKRLANGISVKRLSNGSLTAYQLSAQSARPFPRYEKGVRTCSCTPPLTFVKCLADGSLTAHQISVQSVRPFPRYGKGAYLHVRTCRCTPP